MTNISFKNKSIEELQNDHSQMLATAGDLGFTPTEAQGAVEFDDIEAGVAACTSLHEAITAFRAGLDEGDGKGLASDTEKAQGAPKSPKKAAKKSATKKVTSNKAKDKDPSPAQEKQVAKKAAKKAPAKKAPAKKAAKKSEAKASGGGTPRTKFPEDGVITVKAKENPFRGGRKERFDKLMKFNGKTVKAFLAAGGVSQTLINAVNDGNASVK